MSPRNSASRKRARHAPGADLSASSDGSWDDAATPPRNTRQVDSSSPSLTCTSPSTTEDVPRSSKRARGRRSGGSSAPHFSRRAGDWRRGSTVESMHALNTSADSDEAELNVSANNNVSVDSVADLADDDQDDDQDDEVSSVNGSIDQIPPRMFVRTPSRAGGQLQSVAAEEVQHGDAMVGSPFPPMSPILEPMDRSGVYAEEETEDLMSDFHVVKTLSMFGGEDGIRSSESRSSNRSISQQEHRSSVERPVNGRSRSYRSVPFIDARPRRVGSEKKNKGLSFTSPRSVPVVRRLNNKNNLRNSIHLARPSTKPDERT